ncbi:MAG: cytochrome c maturation protein CcmE [Cyclobacteriaceae bacterium]|nr:cytochrome c maturation protein CcmE [Cyclobacteriaceae bacterium]
MKKTHIFGIVIIAIAVMMIIITAGDASTYVSFTQAKKMADDGNNNKIHVVGQLKKDMSGKVEELFPSEDMLSVSFTMIDNEGREQRVYYNEPMPPDLVKSEQVVVIGSFNEDLFIADKILLKCPSKYQEEEIKL